MLPILAVIVAAAQIAYVAQVPTYGCNSTAEVVELQRIRSDKEAFQKLLSEFTVEVVEHLDAAKRCMALYFALRLAKHGFKFSDAVMDALNAGSKAVASAVPAVVAWHNLALKEMGRPFVGCDAAGDDASGYIAWKFGRGPKPVSGEWTYVL